MDLDDEEISALTPEEREQLLADLGMAQSKLTLVPSDSDLRLTPADKNNRPPSQPIISVESAEDRCSVVDKKRQTLVNEGLQSSMKDMFE